MLPIGKNDSIAAMLPVSRFTDDDYLIMLTKDNLIKRTRLSDFQKIASDGLIAIKLKVFDAAATSPLCHQPEDLPVTAQVSWSMSSVWLFTSSHNTQCQC